MEIKVDKSIIINELKKYLNIKTDIKFAEFLGIRFNTLSSWKVKNILDYDLIISKCDKINANWLITGKGEMLIDKEKTTSTENLLNENLKDRCKFLEESVRLLKQENELLKRILDLTDRIYFLENSKHKSKKDQIKED
ncbi:helix-turn-helix domain-containing protein [Apibacter sp. wkB309]|uniref:helix-turn-helix domain-containing protein n=1 Tax=Apibacter sp. wkB309 TaxID=1679467 RepID=UPI000CF8FCA1|nr:helix-turn-helix domain-containing protein [Apibacter sp. wkB309]PQL89833.1 hypothetical protein C4S75_07530 [Apibacter sp. wkB309]